MFVCVCILHQLVMQGTQQASKYCQHVYSQIQEKLRERDKTHTNRSANYLLKKQVKKVDTDIFLGPVLLPL